LPDLKSNLLNVETILLFTKQTHVHPQNTIGAGTERHEKYTRNPKFRQ